MGIFQTLKLPKLSIAKTVIFSIAACVVFVGAAYAAVNVFHNSEAEAGTRMGNVATVADTSASGSSAIKFGTTPETCPVSTPHLPDGPDGMGGCWPGEQTTGVPAGTTLTAYVGPDTITTPGTVIDSKTVSQPLTIKAANVIIRKSHVIGHIIVDSGNILIEDSIVDGGQGWQGGAVAWQNYEIYRSEILGGWGNLNCDGSCHVEDTYTHGAYAPPGVPTHNNAWITNGNGGNPATVRHNTLWCDTVDNGAGGGCTADLSIFGDFDVVGNITVDKNLFMAGPTDGYCGSFGWNPGKPYGDEPFNIHVTNNIFQRGPYLSTHGIYECGAYGPVTSFKPGNGNIWTNNKFDDGTVIDGT